MTIVSGYLGSGKTTIILNLISQLDKGYQVVWLKNEYGDVSIDSELAKEANIQVKEMLNGCLCCVLVGKLGNAVKDILKDFIPDRIVIESSGTAFPMPILLELSKIPQVEVDGVVNVVDCVNFDGYPDKGEVAKMQAKSTNLIVFNKSDKVDDETLEKVKDDVYELNPMTPKIDSPDGFVRKELLLGLDHKLLELSELEHHDHHDHPDSVDVLSIMTESAFDLAELVSVCESLRAKDIIRIKGVVKGTDGSFHLLNWVYGSSTTQKLTQYSGKTKIVFMGKQMTLTRQLIVDKLTEIQIGDDRLEIS